VKFYFKSSSNSLQLYRFMSDVKAGGMIIMGVRDGRFDESVFEACKLFVNEIIGFGIEGLVVDFERNDDKY
jgi:hypothetical protein